MVRRPLLCAALVAAALAAAPAAGQRGDKPAPIRKAVRYPIALAPGDAAPVFGGVDLQGAHVDVAYGERAATVVGFWSGNCAPCRIQAPALQKLFAERGGDGLQVLGIAVDTGDPRLPPTTARAFLEEHGGTYPVVRSTPAIETAWGGVTILPTTFLVGRNGKLVRRYMGADETIVKGLLDDVEAYLAGRPLGDQALPPPLDDAPPAPPAEPNESPR